MNDIYKTKFLEYKNSIKNIGIESDSDKLEFNITHIR